ncbi:MAG: ArsR/SmtB family transcription factor, partial [Vulcanimicrobiaceae bacterium]
NQPAVSHHLRLLREAGLIAGERRGTWVYYRLEPEAERRIAVALTRVLSSRMPALTP